jgi:hypothetical protein
MFITWTAFLPHFFQKNKKCSIGFDGGSERTLIHRRGAKNAEMDFFPFAVERTAKGNRSVPLKTGLQVHRGRIVPNY